jgi:phenylalanyl-tRNA synthetase beta chain
MKFTLSWLKEHLETGASIEQVSEALTSIGLEVEGIENPADKLAPFTIAHVLSAERHPQADKLQVLSVDAGTGEAIQVVCGAPNARAGMKGVFGAPGAYVPGSDLTLKVAAIRGVESRGMMCSIRELELGDEHDGIIALPDDAPVGESYARWAGLDDPVIDISVTPNRQDCMGVHGVARDLAAAGLGTLKPVEAPEIAGSFPCPVEIRIEDPEGCPAFYGRVVRGVKNGPSPAWLQQRLKAVGQRPISALVDMTNYIMIGWGRPLHVYDLAKLSGAVTARRARDGEEVLALNGKSYALDASITVIANEAGVHDIGGIMGGEHSGVTEGTTDILVECAYFDPERIARTGQKLGLSSDARTRFERGVDPEFLDAGLALATAMAVDLAGGEASEIVRAGQPPRLDRVVAYRPSGPAASAASTVRTPSRPTSCAASASSRNRRSVADRGAELAARCRRPGRHRRGGRAIHGIDRVEAVPLPRRPGVARPTATPGAARRAQGAPHRRRARAQRGRDLELHPGAGGGGVRRRGLGARQSDQRGHEGDAPLAPPRSAGGGAAQPRPRRRERQAVRDRAALPCGRRAADARPRPRRAEGRPPLAHRQARRLRGVRRQGRSAGDPCRRRRAGRQPPGAGAGGRGLPSRPLGAAQPRPQERARFVRRAASRDAQGLRPRRAGGCRGNLPRRASPEARRRP